MMTREELYGGFISVDFPTNTSIVELPPHTDFRLLYCEGNDLSGGGVTLRLPDPKTIRQHGWLVYMIYNGLNSGMSTAVTLTTAGGISLGFINDEEVLLVGLLSAEFPVGDGTWTVVKRNSANAAGTFISETVNFGSTTGLDNACESYLFSTDSWFTYPVLPIVSGTGREISAAEFPDATGSFDCYYGQVAEVYRWVNGIPVLQNPPNYPFIQTGFGVVLGSVIGDLMHVANGVTPANAYKMEVFAPVTDTWTMGVDFPSFTGITAPEVNVCESLGVEEFHEFTFTSPSTLDSSAVFIGYSQIAQIYFVAAYPPWPRGPYRPSCVGIDSRLHFQGGSYSSTSTVISSTDSHMEFNPFLNTWQVLPPIPVIGRGLGIHAFTEPRDRYTFGMGETTSVPSEVHFEYNLTTRTYRNRATFSWGATGRLERESAWASYFP